MITRPEPNLLAMKISSRNSFTGPPSADRHAFAGGEAVEFQHCRKPGPRAPALHRACWRREFRRRNVIADQELLSELLARFELRGLLRRAPAGNAVPRAEIREPLAGDKIALLTRDQRSSFSLRAKSISVSRPRTPPPAAPGRENPVAAREREQFGRRGDSCSAVSSACSRPPLPTTRILNTRVRSQ